MRFLDFTNTTNGVGNDCCLFEFNRDTVRNDDSFCTVKIEKLLKSNACLAEGNRENKAIILRCFLMHHRSDKDASGN